MAAGPREGSGPREGTLRRDLLRRGQLGAFPGWGPEASVITAEKMLGSQANEASFVTAVQMVLSCPVPFGELWGGKLPWLITFADLPRI